MTKEGAKNARWFFGTYVPNLVVIAVLLMFGSELLKTLNGIRANIAAGAAAMDHVASQLAARNLGASGCGYTADWAYTWWSDNASVTNWYMHNVRKAER